MKKSSTSPLFFFMSIFLIVCLTNFIDAFGNFTNASLDVSVDIPATQEWAEFQLNISEIDFNSINVGNESHYEKIMMRNRGNVNITITPILQDNTDNIFSNLYFTYRSPSTSSAYKQIGDWSINRSDTQSSTDLDKWSSWDYFYMKLNLKNYEKDYGPIPWGIENHKNKVIFWVMPRYE